MAPISPMASVAAAGGGAEGDHGEFITGEFRGLCRATSTSVRKWKKLRSSVALQFEGFACDGGAFGALGLGRGTPSKRIVQKNVRSGGSAFHRRMLRASSKVTRAESADVDGAVGAIPRSSFRR